jgi:GTP cyclohydrolase I
MILEKPEELKKATAKRVAKMNAFFAQKPKLKAFANTEQYDQLVIQTGIKVTGICEHHGLAFHCSVSLGYLVDKKLIGLSKLSRLVESHLNPTLPTLQERATQRIADSLCKELKPRGVMVVIRATHDCMQYRGVKKDATTITSALKGLFLTDAGLRSEFLQLINSN